MPFMAGGLGQGLGGVLGGQQMQAQNALAGYLANHARFQQLVGNRQQPQGYVASPGFNFLLGALQSRGWSPQPMPIQGFGGLMGSGGFNNFMTSMTSRFGPASPAYQGFLQGLQERRDARAGVPMVPPQGGASPTAQRRVPAQMGRAY